MVALSTDFLVMLSIFLTYRPNTGGGGGGTWSMNIHGDAAEKCEKPPFSRIKFLKMIPSPGVKFSKTMPYPWVSSTRFALLVNL